MHRILIADTRRVVRAGLRAIFQGSHLVQEIHEAHCSEEINRHLVTHAPDLIFIHQSLLVKIEAHALERASYVVLASEPSLHMLYAAYQHKARGYLSENASTDLFHLALQAEKDTFLLDPLLAGWLLGITSSQHFPSVSLETLTTREQEIFDLMRSGLTNYEIGQHLCISLTTVKKHAANISQKLNLTRRSMKILAFPSPVAEARQPQAVSL